MKSILHKMIDSCWIDPKSISTIIWRMCFETDEEKIYLLEKALPLLPEELGEIKFSENFSSDKYIVLFTHDIENLGAIRNEANILSCLSECQSLTFYGIEGSTGAFIDKRYRGLSDKDALIETSEFLLNKFIISPIEYTMLTCRAPLMCWGIEDESVYMDVVKKYRANSGDYWTAVQLRSPILFKNLLTKMEELKINIAGICLTDYNFNFGHKWLIDNKLTHIGISANSSGKSKVGLLDKKLRGEPYDEQEANFWELLGVWKRPKIKKNKKFFNLF